MKFLVVLKITLVSDECRTVKTGCIGGRMRRLGHIS